MYGSRLGVMNFDKLEIDENFINNTKNDFIIIFMDGTVKKAWSNYANHITEGELCLYLGKSNALNNDWEIDKYQAYNYLGVDGYLAPWNWNLPSRAKPVVWTTERVTMIVMLDDDWTRDTLSRVDPKKYALALLNEEIGEPTFQAADLTYVNLCPRDLYLVTNGTIVKIPSYDDRSEIDKERINEMITKNGLRDTVEAYGRDYEIVISFAKVNEKDPVNNGRMKAKALLFEKDDYKSENPLRPKEFDDDLLMIFYTWEAADNFVKNVKSSTNYVIKTASEYFDQDKEDAVRESKVENKKNMMAVAKICAAMIGTGVVFAGVKVLIEKLIESKSKGKSQILMGLLARSSVFQSGGKIAMNAIRITGGILGFGTHCGSLACAALGLSSLTPIGMAAGIVTCAMSTIAAVGTIIGTVGGLVVDSILDDLEEKPIIGPIVKGARWLGGKIKDGLSWVGEKLSDFGHWVKDKFSDICDSIGGFFSNLFGI
ncbi:MAG: hypothetical protein IJ772_05060 [Bacilli bacterium]|nr:hypothetical protein [Bacilli bacterium]